MQLKKQDTVKKVTGKTRIHNARFYNLSPRGINCMDYNKTSHKLALARTDCSIEIWDMEYVPFQQKVAFGRSLENAIESIVWANDRLFSAGLNGEVIEWDTIKMQPRRQQRVTGNSIWCLAVNKQCTELAIGTEEGYINIFDIENDEFQYKLLFDKQEGRVLCCSFDVTGNFLVTGSIEVLRIWNARTGHAINKMTFPKTVDNHDTIIWTVRVLQDFSIIAGDSRGYITVYDGHTGARLESHQVLKADVLSLNVNKNEDMLICTGVEPLIRIYAKTKIKREDTTYYRWVKYLQRAVHDNNVKVLLCDEEDRIISGGVEGDLGISYITRMRSTISKHGPFLQQPCAVVAGESNFVLLRYTEFLEIWRLGTTNQHDSKDQNLKVAKNLPLTSSPAKLLELRSKQYEPICCASLSQDAKWLCYATLSETRLFQLSFSPAENNKEKLNLERCKCSQLESTPATHLAFSADSQTLFLLTNSTKQLTIFALIDGDGCKIKQTVDVSQQLKGTITHFKVSKCSKNFVLADDCGTVSVWRDYEYPMNLPKYTTAATTAVALHTSLPRVVVAYADNRIAEYDLDKACYTCWCDQTHFVPNTATHCVADILLDERNPDIFILQNDGYLYALEKYMPETAEETEASVGKKAKNSAAHTKGKHITSLRLKYQKPFEHLVHASWIDKEDLLTINVNRSVLMEKLPPAFRQKKYGKA